MIDCSILLATRNRRASLDRTLESLAAQVAPGIEWEVLVADNGSTDDTVSALARWSERLPLRWAVEPMAGKNRALNRVLGDTRGRLLLFTDDDVVLAPGWIAAHAAAAARWPDHDIFAGVIRPLFPAVAPSWAVREPFHSILFAAYEHGATEQPTDHLPFGPNYAVRAPLLLSAGFDAAVGPNGSEYAMGGETEMLRRLTRQGAQTVYVPSAVVEHVVRPEQLTHSFITTRASRFGRGLVRLGDVEWSPHRLFGVPRYLVRQLVEAWVARGWACLKGEPGARLATEFTYRTVLGSIAECRDSGWPLPPQGTLPALQAVPEPIS
jgi:GT2 family glycosyltransferase